MDFVVKMDGNWYGILLSVFSRLGERSDGKVVRDVQWEVNKCLMAGSR